MYHSNDIPDLAGCTLDHGRLRLIRILGSGSSGVTYLAQETTTTPGTSPAEYAVKCIIKAEPNTRRHSLQQQEIKYHKLLSPHPSVVTLHAVHYHQYYIFLVMDYCRSGDLFSYLSERRHYRGDNNVVKDLFLQVVDAVEACHAVGIFHRDIKPENFLVQETEHGTKLYLTDFGLATMNTHSETYGAGSSLYMSPECIGDYAIRQPYNTRANDVWALGVILLSMISGHNPWTTASLHDPCYLAYRHNPNFLREMLPISRSAHHLLARVFRRERAYRVGLPELRADAARVGSFFMHPMEIAAGSAYLREGARMYFRGSPFQAFYLSWDKDTLARIEGDAEMRVPEGPQFECDITDGHGDGQGGPGAFGSSFSSSTIETEGPDTPQLRVRYLEAEIAAAEQDLHARELHMTTAPLDPSIFQPSRTHACKVVAPIPRSGFIRRFVGRFRAE